MDTNHAIGGSLIGLGLAALLVRLVWIASPPFNTMAPGRLSAWKAGLVASVAALFCAGAYFLSLPVSPEAAQRMAEEGFRFH